MEVCGGRNAKNPKTHGKQADIPQTSFPKSKPTHPAESSWAQMPEEEKRKTCRKRVGGADSMTDRQQGEAIVLAFTLMQLMGN